MRSEVNCSSNHDWLEILGSYKAGKKPNRENSDMEESEPGKITIMNRFEEANYFRLFIISRSVWCCQLQGWSVFVQAEKKPQQNTSLQKWSSDLKKKHKAVFFSPVVIISYRKAFEDKTWANIGKFFNFLQVWALWIDCFSWQDIKIGIVYIWQQQFIYTFTFIVCLVWQ